MARDWGSSLPGSAANDRADAFEAVEALGEGLPHHGGGLIRSELTRVAAGGGVPRDDGAAGIHEDEIRLGAASVHPDGICVIRHSGTTA